jgi:hypothetical protein
MKDVRNREWFIRITKINHITSTDATINEEIYEYDFDNLYNQLIEKYTTVLYIIHDKDPNNIHAHFVIQNDTVIRFPALKKMIPYGDIEVQKGNNKDVYNYLLHYNQEDKELYTADKITHNIEKIEEWLLIEKGQGRRNDISLFYNDIDAGYTDLELRKKYPLLYSRYNNMIERTRQLLNEEKSKSFRTNLKVHYWYGDSGTGKTYLAITSHDINDVYIVNSYDKGSFDNYRGQKVVIFDEFRGDIPISSLLQYLDIYPLQLPARYNNKWAVFTEIYLISNIPLSNQYYFQDTETWKALRRRIHDYRRFTSDTIYIFDPNDKIVDKVVNPKSEYDKNKQYQYELELYGF